MAEKTKISYCDATANAWWSCSRVHVGCTSCYAEQLAGRFGIPWGPSAPRRYMPGWRKVLAKVARRAEREGRILKVFLNDMSDLFDDHDGDVVDAKKQRLWIRGSQIVVEARDFTENTLRGNRFEPLRIAHLRQQVFEEVDRYADRLTFLMLTKRPQNIRRMWVQPRTDAIIPDGADCERYRENVWLLYSASDQASLDAGLPHLLACRDLAPVLGLSLEPLIGPVDLCFVGGGQVDTPYHLRGNFWEVACENHCGFAGMESDLDEDGACPNCGCDSAIIERDEDDPGIDWVIVGGESGPRHRPMEIAWVKCIAEQCAAAGVPLWVKQDCGSKPGQQGRIEDEIWVMKQFPKGMK